MIFELADYFLCVVNDFTSLDQRYLDTLTRSLPSPPPQPQPFPQPYPDPDPYP